MTDEIIGQEFRLKEKYEKRNYFIEEIRKTKLISRKNKKVCKILNYTEHLPILASAVTGCVSVSAFASLVDIPTRITSSAAATKLCAITAGIKKYKLIIKKMKNKYDKIMLLVKTTLNTIEILITKNPNISHDEIGWGFKKFETINEEELIKMDY